MDAGTRNVCIIEPFVNTSGVLPSLCASVFLPIPPLCPIFWLLPPETTCLIEIPPDLSLFIILSLRGMDGVSGAGHIPPLLHLAMEELTAAALPNAQDFITLSIPLLLKSCVGFCV